MDPAESILSMLDYSFDSILQDESTYQMDMNLGLDEVFNNNNTDLLSTDDNLISDVLNDDLLNSLDFADSLAEADLFEPLLNSKNYKPRNKSKITLNSIKNTNSLQPHKAFSILNNSADDRNIRAKLSMCAPKVYVSQSPKQTSVQAGTSILVKNATGRKPKRRSLLQSSETTIKYNSFLSKPTNESQRKGILKDVFLYSLVDHDYCLQPANEFSNFQPKSNNSKSYSQTNVETQVKNEIEDMLHGFIPDDVMLNELPNCLKDLIDLDSELMLNSEDVLHGLNDACNLMADQYIDNLEEELFSMDKSFNLPNLNITEDDLNEVTQIFDDEEGASKDHSAAKDIEIDIVYSPFTESVSDSFDCASTSTGCTEESSSEESSCHLSRSLDISKRHRSLSSSSVTSRRKRRFSSRSSLNSSDSMSDSSSVDSVSSSRSSSPDRSLNLPGFGSFSSNFGSPKHLLKSNKNRLRKQSNWSSKYSNKFIKAPTVKKKKANVDLSHRNFSLNSGKELSRLDAGSSHKVGGGDGEVNEKVLYIGDIPDGTSKSDIRSWFGKYGTIEDIQLYFCETSNNYAFVTFKYSQETKNAIKYGNDELRKLNFVLSYGRRRNNSYKDLDFFSEENLDFRIEQSKELDFDSLLRSTTAESYKLKQYV